MGLASSSAPSVETFTSEPAPPKKPIKTGITPRCTGRLYADPGQAVIIEGEAYPQVLFCRAEPGVNGCTSRYDLDSVDRYQIKHGRTPIPLDIEVVAWGQKLHGYVTRTLALMSGTEEVYHYHTVWERYTTIGSQTIREWDAEGWLNLLRRVRDVVGGIPAQIEDAGRAKVRALSDLYRESTSPADQRYADTLDKSLITKE